MTHRSQPSRALCLAGLTTGALLASAGGASAEILPDDLGVGTVPVVADTVNGVVATTTGSLQSAVDPALDLQLDPLANTTTDPLSNAAGTQVADFPGLSTAMLTGPVTEGASARELPGEVLTRLLGGLPVALPPPVSG
ncbi:hypothetical protein [Streptomyces sp. NBC_01803]|uniref:hypothetical protein n=1 Tax=Streptomyces sp. NBC_01803 TaxID=2975946 RepID=UPI002DD7A51D|nr:hypothetical protein [Streptomyces sp. NBC_01803]WSA45700.1 hypothetical protein OIE51_16725 [Streptomyces sp. NBC_01803]